MAAFVLQSVTPAGEERYRPEWTKAINEDDIIGMVKLIITCHTSTGKASEFTDNFIAIEDYRNFAYKEGTTIAEYANQLYLLDRKILQVGATHLSALDQVYMVMEFNMFSLTLHRSWAPTIAFLMHIITCTILSTGQLYS